MDSTITYGLPCNLLDYYASPTAWLRAERHEALPMLGQAVGAEYVSQWACGEWRGVTYHPTTWNSSAHGERLRARAAQRQQCVEVRLPLVGAGGQHWHLPSLPPAWTAASAHGYPNGVNRWGRDVDFHHHAVTSTLRALCGARPHFAAPQSDTVVCPLDCEVHHHRWQHSAYWRLYVTADPTLFATNTVPLTHQTPSDDATPFLLCAHCRRVLTSALDHWATAGP